MVAPHNEQEVPANIAVSFIKWSRISSIRVHVDGHIGPNSILVAEIECCTNTAKEAAFAALLDPRAPSAEHH